MKYDSSCQGSSVYYYLFLVGFYFFIMRDWLEQQISFLGYIDEILAMMAVPIAIVSVLSMGGNVEVKRTSSNNIPVCLFLFIIAGLVGTVLYNYQPLKASMSDLFTCLKFWLVIYVGGSFSRRFSLEEYANKIFFHIKFLTLLFALLAIVDNIFHVFPASQEARFGIRCIQLFYSHPTVVSSVCATLVILLLGIRQYVEGTNLYFVILLIIMCLTMRSKAIAGAVAIALIYYFAYVRKKRITLKTCILFVPLLILIGWDQFSYYFLSIQSESARYQLWEKSIQIMKDYFPFGTGFATYGTNFSAVYYSPVYEMYGLSGIYGLRKGASSFISDSFWPGIFAETGFLGTVCYISALLFLFSWIQKIRKYRTSSYVAALSIFAFELIDSTSESAFFHPLSIPMAFLLGYFLYEVTEFDEHLVM